MERAVVSGWMKSGRAEGGGWDERGRASGCEASGGGGVMRDARSFLGGGGDRE